MTDAPKPPPVPLPCSHPRILFGRCASCGLPRSKTLHQGNGGSDDLRLRGSGSTGTGSHRFSAARIRRIAKVTERAFALRDEGFTPRDIAIKLHLSLRTVEGCLCDHDYVKRRIENYNEQLRAYSPQAIRVIRDVLYDPEDKRCLDTARWLLETTKVIGKESPMNVFINAPGIQQVVLNHEEIEAARTVAEAMRQKELPPAPKGEIIDAEIVATTEEKSVGGTTSSPDLPKL